MARKKIMIVVGSNRKGGNTATVAKWVADGAREAGAEVETVDAARLKYKANGCTACMGCQNSKEYRCAIKDEASDILARIPECSTLVIASPVYFMGFSAQTKLFLDRMFSLMKIDHAKDKVEHALKNTEIALIATCGGDKGSGLALIQSNIDAIAGFFGKKARKLAIPFAPFQPGEIESNVELKEKAESFGASLV